jgi:hypothetical protein
MADMRASALCQARPLRIVSVLMLRMYPPRVTGAQHVPLWKIAGPHTGRLKPGPSGPGFYLSRDCAILGVRATTRGQVHVGHEKAGQNFFSFERLAAHEPVTKSRSVAGAMSWSQRRPSFEPNGTLASRRSHLGKTR